MRPPATSPPVRQWADVTLMVVGLALVGASVWVGVVMQAENVRAPDVLWGAYAAAGVLALLALFTAQRWRRRRLAQALDFVASVVLGLSLWSFSAPGWRVWATVLAVLVLLGLLPFIGPMPRAR